MENYTITGFDNMYGNDSSNFSSTTALPVFNSTSSSPNYNAAFPNITLTEELFWFDYHMYASTGKIVAYSLVYGLLSIVSLTGNIMVFMVVLMNRTMRTATNVLLLNVALCDMMFVLIVVPGLLAELICSYRWPLGESLGKMSHLMAVLCPASSAFTMTVLAFERFLAVVRPFKQMARKKNKKIALAILIIWVGAVGLSFPSGYYTTTVPRKMPVNRDGEVKVLDLTELVVFMGVDQSKAYLMTLLICINVAPIIFLSYYYTRIAWKLWHPDQQLAQEAVAPSTHQNRQKLAEKSRRKTTMMLLTVVIVFLLCTFPFYLIRVLRSYDVIVMDHDTVLLIIPISEILYLVNATINPIIYYIFNQKFRTGFKHIFFCHCHALKMDLPTGR